MMSITAQFTSRGIAAKASANHSDSPRQSITSTWATAELGSMTFLRAVLLPVHSFLAHYHFQGLVLEINEHVSKVHMEEHF